MTSWHMSAVIKLNFNWLFGFLRWLFTSMVMRYGQTVTDGKKNHLEISDSETNGTMCDLAPTFFLLMYVVPQRFMQTQQQKLGKYKKCPSVTISVKFISLTYVRHRNKQRTIIIDHFLV